MSSEKVVSGGGGDDLLSFEDGAIDITDGLETSVYTKGDFVTRTGEDIHYVLECNEYGSGHFICVVPDSRDVYERGEVESNLVDRYHAINRHFLRFAMSELELIKSRFPDEFVE